MRDRWNEIHEYVTRDADRRDADTEARHRELLRTVEFGLKLINQTLEKGMNNIASAIRGR